METNIINEIPDLSECRHNEPSLTLPSVSELKHIVSTPVKPDLKLVEEEDFSSPESLSTSSSSTTPRLSSVSTLSVLGHSLSYSQLQEKSPIIESITPPKKKRGRPRKFPLKTDSASGLGSAADGGQVKRKRGRPKLPPLEVREKSRYIKKTHKQKGLGRKED
ncbi:hypothetical protein CANARDRAFT_29224 [[Candida] arabinofermentans NRRL YB-2248]|uniref:Uncharacterized protein n=1 Tax=[Candida] arabinofermentans NRRL YB-2248 TaxID=983967 RepID=A0A1E4SXX3_9ASCO|nr:hypothetical protein CANARDRAFT_29224 [[Candida] arabinofermentans NRRL YB-2248]